MSSSGTHCPEVMSFLLHARAGTAPGPGWSWARLGAESRRFGAEVGRLAVWGGPARSLGDWPRFELACSTTASAGPTRRPRAQGPVRRAHGHGEFIEGQLHGRRLSRRALDHPGSGRRERSDRRTHRVAVASTCEKIGHHAGRQFSPCTHGIFRFFVAGASATTTAAEGDAVPGPHCMKKGDPPANNGGGSPQGGVTVTVRRRAASALRSRDAPPAAHTAPDRAGSGGPRSWTSLRPGLR